MSDNDFKPMDIRPEAKEAFEKCMDVMNELLQKSETTPVFADAVIYVGIGILSSCLSLATSPEDIRHLKNLVMRATDTALENYIKVVTRPNDPNLAN